jgi:glycosyltransferase involved in cell wall biosynthesis
MDNSRQDYLPDISVVVCTFNHAKWLERCIRSLNHQVNIAQEAFEILLVDDASTDDTERVLQNIESIPNLRIVRNEENRGLPASVNRAIRMARGRYIVRVDSDDYVARPFLYLQKLFLDMNRSYQAVAVDYVMVDAFENQSKRVNCLEEEIACGIMFRKECLFDIGLYDEDFRMREGHELRRRFEEKFSVARLEFPLYKYRSHSENRTKNIDNVMRYDQKLAEQKGA